MKCTILIASLSVLFLSVTTASAVIVGIDIDSGGAPPTNWNQIGSSGTFSNLIDETGTTTNVDVTMSISSSNLSQGIDGTTIPSHVPDLAGLDDFNASASSIVFSNLVAGQTYDIWIFSVYDDFGVNDIGGSQFDATVTGSGAPSVFSFDMNSVGDLVINGLPGSSANPLDFYAAPIAASLAGTISIAFSSTGGLEIPLAGVAIRVPEPTSLALVFAGITVLSATRRRRKA
jgi:hypothetical protein